jgi:hypothetical protein
MTRPCGCTSEIRCPKHTARGEMFTLIVLVTLALTAILFTVAR